jgi:hypothetical protein
VILAVVVLLIAGGGIRGIRHEVQALFSSAPTQQQAAETPPTPTPIQPQPAAPQPTPSTPTTPAPKASAPTPPVSRPTPPPPAADTSKQAALVDQAARAATTARAVLERADEAARAARAMAGEARIVAARAARPDLQGAERITSDSGVSYVGQVADGKRQGLGVADLKNGERQAGDWNDDRLNGLGTVRLEDDTRYAGQWHNGQSTGLGAREKPGVDRAEGNFVDGRLEGLGSRRTLAEPGTVQSGEFRADLLEGPGVETVGEQRYEGGFKAGKRQGYGQLSSPGGKVQSGRWEDGKPVETTP